MSDFDNEITDWTNTIEIPLTDDEKAFGVGQWIYCAEHLRPHKTGYCSVGVSQKLGLGNVIGEEKLAYRKCREFGLKVK